MYVLYELERRFFLIGLIEFCCLIVSIYVCYEILLVYFIESLLLFCINSVRM